MPVVKLTSSKGNSIDVDLEEFTSHYQDFVRSNSGATVRMYNKEGKATQVGLGDARRRYREDGYRYEMPKPSPANTQDEKPDVQVPNHASQLGNLVQKARTQPKVNTQTNVATPETPSQTPVSQVQIPEVPQAQGGKPMNWKDSILMQMEAQNLARQSANENKAVTDAIKQNKSLKTSQQQTAERMRSVDANVRAQAKREKADRDQSLMHEGTKRDELLALIDSMDAAEKQKSKTATSGFEPTKPFVGKLDVDAPYRLYGESDRQYEERMRNSSVYENQRRGEDMAIERLSKGLVGKANIGKDNYNNIYNTVSATFDSIAKPLSQESKTASAHAALNPGRQGSAESANRRYNEALGSEKMQNAVMSMNYNDIIKSSLYGEDGKYQSWVTEGAKKSGMSIENYVSTIAPRVITNKITQALGEKSKEHWRIKNYAEFIFSKIADGVTADLMMGAENAGAHAEAMQHYEEKLGFLGKAGGYAAWGASSAPEFMMGGAFAKGTTAVAAPIVRKVAATKAVRAVAPRISTALAKGAEQLTGSRAAAYATMVGKKVEGSALGEFMERTSLANLGKIGFWKSRALPGAVNSGLNFGAFEGLGGAKQEMAYGDGSVGSILGATLTNFGHGFVTGAGLGVFTPLGRMMELSAKSTLGRIGATLVAKELEATYFTTVDAIESGNWSLPHLLDKEMENTAMVYGMAFGNNPQGWLNKAVKTVKGMRTPMQSFRALTMNRGGIEGLALTPAQMNWIHENFPEASITGLLNGRITDASLINEGRAFAEFMTLMDKAPWTIKQKLGGAVLGMMDPVRPSSQRVGIQGNRLNFYSADGELIDVKEFEDYHEMQAMTERDKMERTQSRAQNLIAQYSLAEIGEDKSADFTSLLDEVAERHGIKSEKLTELCLGTDPTRMNDAEREAVRDLVESSANLVREHNDGINAPEASAELGAATADSVDLVAEEEGINNGTVIPDADGTPGSKAIAELTARRQQYSDRWDNESAELMDLLEGKGIGEIYATVREDHISNYVANGLLTEEEGRRALEIISNRNNLFNTMREIDAFIEHTGEKIDEAVQMRAFEFAHGGLIDGKGSAANVIVYATDREGHQYALIDGDVESATGKVSSESGMVVVKDLITGESDFKTPDELSVTNMENRADYEDRLRTELQVRIDQAYGLSEAMGEGAAAGQQAAEGTAPRTEGEAAGQQPTPEGEGAIPPVVDGEGSAPLPLEGEGEPGAVLGSGETPAEPEITVPANVSNPDAFKANATAYRNGKVEGSTDSVRLADGTKLDGRYVLVGSDNLVASHDAETFKQREGAPQREDGKTMNDRDYENDKMAQMSVQQHAANYDERAIQDMPVVTKDGIVISGNDRTMSGQLAGKNGTDAEYTQYLLDHAEKFGFTREQVQQMIDRGEHPRVVLELNNDVPYTTETYAQFNKTNMKKRNFVEEAVAQGKVMKEKPELVGKVTAIIEKVENLSDLYNDDDLSKELVQYLVNDGVISKEEIAEWLNDEGMMSDIGKRKFETLMTSIVLDEDAIRLLNNPDYKLGKVRQNIAYSIVELMKNQRLGEYSILNNINKALELYGRAKGAKAKTDRDILSWLAEADMFTKEAPIDSYTDEEIVLALNMSKGQRQFKAFIKTYNEMAREAANGQTDMFAEGGVKTKEQIIQELAKTLGYDNITTIREQRARAAQEGEGGTTGEPPRKPDAPGNDEGRGAGEGESGVGEKPKGEEPIPPKGEGEGGTPPPANDTDPLTPEGAKKHKENHPLTEAEIERYGEGDDDLIDDAKDYLSGNAHDNNTLSAYEIIYDRKVKAEAEQGEGNEPFSWIDHENHYNEMSEEEFQPHANRFIDEYKAINGTMNGVTSAMQQKLRIGYNKATQARMNYEHPKPKAPESPRSGNEGTGTTAPRKPVSGEQKAATEAKANKVKSGLAALKAAKEKAKAAQEASKVIGGAKADEELGSIIGNIGRDPEVASAFREVTNSIAEYGLEVIKEGETGVDAWKKRVTEDFGEDAKEILEMTDKEWDDYLNDTLTTKKVRMDGERKSVAEWMGYHRFKDHLEANKEEAEKMSQNEWLEAIIDGDKAVKEAEAKGDKLQELIDKGALDALKEEYEKRFKNESNEGVQGVGSDGSAPSRDSNEKEPSGEQGDDRGRVPSGTGDKPETGSGATGGVRVSSPDDVDPADLPPTGGTGGDTKPSSAEGVSGTGTDGEQPSGRPTGVVSGDGAGTGTDNGGLPESGGEDSRTSGGDNRSAAERNRANLGAKVAEALKKGAEKVKYVARSAARAIGSVIPTGMADAVNENLAKFDDIDGFLVSELGYKDKDELHKYLAAEQVDSVALAIKAMQQGYAMVISDQTGVGKGRQAASLLRYAMQQGKTPIFFTERVNLIQDLYRDMVETGNGKRKPFILANKDLKSVSYKTPEGDVIIVNAPTAKEMSYFLTNGKLPKGYDYIVTNYSQINSENTASYRARREAVKKFAKRNYIIMDESHNAAGQSNTGEYIKGLVNDADGLTFLSATFAKNPSCMPLYAIRSVMADANLEADQIIAAMKVGGVPLQEIVAEALTKSGANIRRERDMEGVKVNWTPMKAEPTVQRQRYDDVINAFRKITDFQDEHIRPIIAKITELAEKQKEHIFYMGNRARLYNLANQMTTAIKVEGVVKEALDALKRGEKVYISMAKTNSAMMDDFFKVGEKVDKADIAKTLLRSLDKCFDYLRIIPSPIPGEEPIKIRERLSLMDLMGDSQDAYEALKEELTSLITDLPISPIDAIRMALEDAGYKVGEITGRGTMIDRDENGDLIYKKREKQNTNDVIEDYNNGDTDVILMNESGTTGWSGQNSPKFKDKSGIDMGYGEGHRQRHHIVLEPQKDAPTEIQGRGRGDRTGQLSRCIYTYVMSHIPAENRILMMMKKKLATLDAQTTAAGKQKFSEVDTVDFGNKYGSEVVVDILKEDKGLVMELDDPFGWYANVPDGVGDRRRASYISKENDYERVMKRIAMLTTDEQEAFYEQVIERYNSRIETLNATGMNDLETTHMPLDAETLQVAELIHGEAPGSDNVFADSAYVEEVEVNVLNKPMTRQEVEASIENSLTHTVEGEDGKKTKERYANEEEYRQSLIDQINEFERTETERLDNKKVEDFNKRMKLAEDRIRKQAKEDAEKGKPWTSEQMAEALDAAEEKIRENVERAHKKALNLLSDKIGLMRPGLEGIKLGSYYNVPVKLPNGKGAKQVNGIVIGFKIANNKSAATSSVVVATTDGRKTFNIPFRDATAISYMVSQSKNGGWNGEGRNRVADWDSMVSGKMEGREKRHIITGNLLTAIANGQRGQIVQYTTKDGEVKRGILLPKDVDLSKMGKAKPLIEAADKVVTNDESVTTADKLFTIRLNSGKNFDGTYEILINSKSAKRVEKYLDDEDLKKLLYNGDWDETSKGYRAGLTTSDVENVMRHLTDKYNAQYNEALNFDADSQQDNAIKDIKRTKQYGIDTLERYFEEWNSDDETKALADEVFKIAEKLGLNCSFGSTSAKYVGGAYNWGKNTITLKYNFFAYNKDSQYRAEVLLHEVIHSVTAYAVIAKEKGKLVAGKHDNIIRAVDELQATYEAIKSDASIRDEYGATSIHEMMAEMANIRFREKLKSINLWDRLRNAVTDVVRALFADFMPERTESAYDRISKNIKTLLDNFDGDLYNEIVGGERYEDEDTSLGKRLDPKDEDLSTDDKRAIEELNSGKTKKVYRAMQVIDGKLYPPMAAKVGGKLVEGAKQGDILKADEHPEHIKIDKSGKPQFILDKGGKDATGKKATSVPARYNPYWHTSNSMLNDQFKSAWIRPNMVVVEVEIPESELTSGYKAEHAKDAVGMVPWKSGVVTGQLVKQGHPGREVYLSRYCKIGRVVPEDEAAQHIKEFIGDRDVEIPVNTVTPKLREALEKAGVKIGEPEKGVKMNEQIKEAVAAGLEVDNSIRYRTPDNETSPETVATARESGAKASVVSSDAGAKVLQNLETTKESYKNRPNKPRGFITDLVKSLGLKNHGPSNYGDFILPDGTKLTVRVSNHNARVSFFDENGENEGVSIVISRHHNKGLKNDGKAHVVEFFYSKRDIEKAEGKPLADIIDSVQEMLKTGEYVDKTGLAKPEEVNKDSVLYREMTEGIPSTPRDPHHLVVDTAQNAVDALGGNGFVHESKENLPTRAKVALAKNPKAMGYYDPKTGEVHIFAFNCPTRYEAERTVQHEKIAHEGLRGLLGKEGYNNFMRDLWMGMDAETRKEVTAKAQRNGWDFYTAMDELMGEKAENFKDDNRTFWQHVKDTWNAVMRGLGFKTSMTEQSIREALWLSANRLKNKEGNLEYKIRKAAFDFKNKRRVPEEAVSKDGYRWGNSASSDEDVRFRTMTPEDREKIELTPSGMMAERKYIHEVSSIHYLYTEAHQNNLRSLQILQDSICGKGRVKDTENAFMLLNHLGSKDQQEQSAYQRHLVDPLTKTLQKALSAFDGKKAKDRYQNLEHYVYAKHGLERNRVLDVRDYVNKGMKDDDKAVRDAAQQFGKDFDDLRSQLRTDLDAGAITLAEYFQQMDDFIRTEIPDWEVRDRSGLSDETFDWGNGDGTYDDAEVIAHVMDCEAKMGKGMTDELWQRIHDLSSFAVGKDYDCGMMNSKAKRRMETMFDWYVPLRGFNEDVAEDMWNYINSEMGGVGKTNMTAKGRVSRADSPLATLVAMGDSAILRGNRNKAKQALVRLARNNQNNLLTEMKVAYHETTDTYGNDVLKPIYPEFREDMTADEIEQAIDDYNVRIENMKAAGEKVTFLTDRRGNVPYRVVRPKDMDQHLITAKINGKDVTLIVHSHPRAAQAVNGLLRNGTKYLGWLKSFNSFMSQLATSRSLTFMARNAIRDYGFATFSTFATEGLKYNKDFQVMYWKLTGKAAGNLGSSAMTPSNVNGMMNSMANLFSKYRSKSLDMNNEVERYFKEFVDNGGVTGYVQTKGVDDIKTQIDANIAKAYRSKKKKASEYVTKKLLGSYFDLVETVNESVENQARFATFYASRKAHRSVTRSVNDAKKVSVNFNLTGAGSATLSMKMGNEGTWHKVNRVFAGTSAWWLKNVMWFYNAGVQGMSRSAQVMVGDGVKSAQFAKAVGGFVAVPFAMGMMLPALNAMIAMHDDDEDRKKYGDNPYTQLPEFERRQNLCFYLGHGRFMKIPMAIEGRAFLGLGDIAASVLTNPEMKSEKDITTQIAEQFTQITPMDIMGGSKVGSNDMAGSILGTVVPSGVQPIIAAGLPGTGFKGTNVSWMGTPISQDGRFNKNDPNFTKANAKTSNGFVKFAEYMNSISGGDEVIPGKIDIDPSKMEYLLESYGSGPAKDIIETINFITNTVQTDGNVQGGKVPVLKAVYRNASPANSRNTDRTRWYAFRNEAEATNTHLSKYKTKGMTLEQRTLRDSEEGQRAKIVKYYQKRIKKYETQKNKATTRADRDMYQEHINELIHDAITKIDNIGKQ